MLEAILASALLFSAILFRTQIENKHAEVEKIREFASSVVAVPYGIDKRTLLDGHTLSLSKTSFVGAQETFESFLKESLIGNTSPSCTGGWAPRETVNGALALISCKQFNYNKMPFKFEMDGGYELNANNSVRRYYVDFYHKTEADFKEFSHVYPQLMNFSRLMDSPQITGTHKYSLIHKATKKELTPSQCLSAKEFCSFRAEYLTNYVGMGEDVYLRVNGSNFMLNSIRFKGLGSAAYKCNKLSSTGAPVEVACGIEYAPQTSPSDGLMAVNTDDINTQDVNLVNNKMLDSSNNLIPVKCKWDRNGTVIYVPCGLSLVKNPLNGGEVISRAALHDVSASGNIYTLNGSDKTFSVEGRTGNVLAKGKLNVLGGVDLSQVASSGGKNSLVIDNTKVQFDGAHPTYLKKDVFNKVSGKGIASEFANELVTKGYMHSFNQIIDISVKQSGSTHNLYRCPNGAYANVIGFPYNSALVSSSGQINNVCPYSAGRRLPSYSIKTNMRMPKPNNIEASTAFSATVGCRWEGDYAQAWFMNENRTTGKFSPRFYLVSPRKYGGGVANIEVTMKFSTIQYCGAGGLR